MYTWYVRVGSRTGNKTGHMEKYLRREHSLGHGETIDILTIA